MAISQDIKLKGRFGTTMLAALLQLPSVKELSLTGEIGVDTASVEGAHSEELRTLPKSNAHTVTIRSSSEEVTGINARVSDLVEGPCAITHHWSWYKRAEYLRDRLRHKMMTTTTISSSQAPGAAESRQVTTVTEHKCVKVIEGTDFNVRG